MADRDEDATRPARARSRVVLRAAVAAGVLALGLLPATRPPRAGATESTVVASPHKGVLPPKNPSESLPPDPDFLQATACHGATDDASCNDLVAKAVDHARSVLEHLGEMDLSIAAFLKLTRAEQLFVTVDLERTERGLPAATELTRTFDTTAEKAAAAGTDPALPEYGTTLPGGGFVDGTGGNWAAGWGTPLASDYGWMYDDGPGKGSPNSLCRTEHKGCWGHRDNILGTFADRAQCGGGHYELAMGVGYVSGTSSPDGYSDSETELFVGVCGKAPTDTVFTWAKAERLLGLT